MKPKPNKKKPTTEHITHKSFFYPTNENWPNFERNTLHVRFHESINHENGNIFMRISVWGIDDFGMEKDFFVTKSNRHEIYMFCIDFLKKLPNPLTEMWLKSQGFVYA